MDEKMFLERLENKESFTEKELEDLVFEYEVELEYLCENGIGRWTIPVRSIIQIANKYYSIYWDRAATEMQENYFCGQPEEVEHVMRTKVVQEWVTVT